MAYCLIKYKNIFHITVTLLTTQHQNLLVWVTHKKLAEQ